MERDRFKRPVGFDFAETVTTEIDSQLAALLKDASGDIDEIEMDVEKRSKTGPASSARDSAPTPASRT